MYIRTRLALLFALILAVALGVLSEGVYHLTRNDLLEEVQRDVRERAAGLAATVRPEPGSEALHLPDLMAFGAPDVFLEVVDEGGEAVARSGNLGAQDLPFHVSAIRRGVVEEARLGRVPLFLFGRPVIQDSQTRGYVLVARSPLTIYTSLSRMRSFLFPGSLIALVIAALAGWILTWWAMRPLARLALAAGGIAATQDHTRRVGSTGLRNEVGRLATAVDTMLAALEDAHRHVTAVNEGQRRFLAEVSHELRTPLTIMLSSLDVLERTGDSDPGFLAETLRDLRTETGRMARMVNQLLMMAPSSDELPRRPVLIAEVVVDACRQTAAAENGATVSWDGIHALDDAVVDGTSDRLKQLFLILLDNAVKYTPAGGRIDVSGAVDGRTVTVTVADTGIGIAHDELPQVFDRFFRSENARSREGSGLGLSIARHISEQHGGELQVESELGRGSRFTVTLPRLA
ncbi:MAG TPA: HAMP domain-containing sensor histidine kinase [Actinomycetota bacterium]